MRLFTVRWRTCAMRQRRRRSTSVISAVITLLRLIVVLQSCICRPVVCALTAGEDASASSTDQYQQQQQQHHWPRAGAQHLDTDILLPIGDLRRRIHRLAPSPLSSSSEVIAGIAATVAFAGVDAPKLPSRIHHATPVPLSQANQVSDVNFRKPLQNGCVGRDCGVHGNEYVPIYGPEARKTGKVPNQQPLVLFNKGAIIRPGHNRSPPIKKPTQPDSVRALGSFPATAQIPLMGKQIENAPFADQDAYNQQKASDTGSLLTEFSGGAKLTDYVPAPEEITNPAPSDLVYRVAPSRTDDLPYSTKVFVGRMDDFLNTSPVANPYVASSSTQQETVNTHSSSNYGTDNTDLQYGTRAPPYTGSSESNKQPAAPDDAYPPVEFFENPDNSPKTGGRISGHPSAAPPYAEQTFTEQYPYKFTGEVTVTYHERAESAETSTGTTELYTENTEATSEPPLGTKPTYPIGPPRLSIYETGSSSRSTQTMPPTAYVTDQPRSSVNPTGSSTPLNQTSRTPPIYVTQPPRSTVYSTELQSSSRETTLPPTLATEPPRSIVSHPIGSPNLKIQKLPVPSYITSASRLPEYRTEGPPSQTARTATSSTYATQSSTPPTYATRPTTPHTTKPPSPTYATRLPSSLYVTRPQQSTYPTRPPPSTYATGPPSPTYATRPPSPKYATGPPSPTIAIGLPSPTYATGPPPPTYATGPPSPTYATGPPPPTYATGPPSPTYATGPPPPTYATGPPSPTYATGPPPLTYATGLPSPTYVTGPPPPTYVPGSPSPTNATRPTSSTSATGPAPSTYATATTPTSSLPSTSTVSATSISTRLPDAGEPFTPEDMRITSEGSSVVQVFLSTKPPIPFINESAKTVPNRIRGKAHIFCEEEGLQFRVQTLFPFSGQIFAHERKQVPECYFTFQNAQLVNITLPYSSCGILNAGKQRAQTQYHVQIIMVFEQLDNTSTVQSFMAQCVHQKILYQKQVIPKRIEEALEELQLVPTKLEQKAPIPDCVMRIIAEDEHGHGGQGTEVDVVDLGQPMKIEWRLEPESEAYGFHVRNCTVRDLVGGTEFLVIDERGCSSDINIFAHPHYDTYHDVAVAHWHAFKVPDNSRLSIKCTMQICLDIVDSDSGITSCDTIPSPPFCPDLITSPYNSILFDTDRNMIKKREITAGDRLHQHVHADLCLGDATDQYCNSADYRADRDRHLNQLSDDEWYCFSRIWLSACTGLSIWTTILAIGIYGYCRLRRKHLIEKLSRSTNHSNSSSDSTTSAVPANAPTSNG